jgi:hypothetical protein
MKCSEGHKCLPCVYLVNFWSISITCFDSHRGGVAPVSNPAAAGIILSDPLRSALFAHSSTTPRAHQVQLLKIKSGPGGNFHLITSLNLNGSTPPSEENCDFIMSAAHNWWITTDTRASHCNYFFAAGVAACGLRCVRPRV